MKKRHIIIGLGIILIIFSLLFMRFGGVILVSEDDLKDVKQAPLVLLMGSVGDRAFGAYDLYEDGKVEHIYMVDSYLSGQEILEERGISIPGDAQLSQYILMELGVPEEAITVLPGDAESTKDEAMVMQDFLQKHPEIDELILTTSKFHSYRSEKIFTKALEDVDVDIYSSPTPYDPYEARGWYQDREDIQRVITEYIKLANHFIIEQFQM